MSATNVIAVFDGKAISLSHIIDMMDKVTIYVVGLTPSFFKCPVFNMQIGHMAMFPKPALMLCPPEVGEIPESIKRLATVIKRHDGTPDNIRIATEAGIDELMKLVAAQRAERERRQADVALSDKRPRLEKRELCGSPISWGFMGWVPVTDNRPTPETDTALSNDRRWLCVLYDETIELLPAPGVNEVWASLAGVPVIAWSRVPLVDFYALLDEYRRHDDLRLQEKVNGDGGQG